MKAGKVYLVGAGPGDPGLITRKGLACLASADVVVYDRLLDDRILDPVPARAERIYVGKRTGEHTREQDEINRLLVAKAREGKCVVRLKGGDPFVLGRGGEEAEALRDNGVPFEVVPGVSSAVAVPAYAGIPVTHRGLASSFTVVTGHEDPDKTSSSIDWEKLATGADTLVFLMGLRNLPRLAARLLENGRPAATPVAVIKDGTRPGQTTVTGTLKDIAARVKGLHIDPPAVIVVGEVVRLRQKLSWFEGRPLFGKRVLVTRARRQAGSLSRLLYERGARPIELPAIEIQPVGDTGELDRAIADLGRYRWLLFTSVNGVAAFFERLHKLNLDARALGNLKICAIGPATADALRGQAIVPDFVPGVYTGEGIIDGLRGRNIAGQRFLLPRADIADRELVEGLRGLGAEVHEIAAYRTAAPAEGISRAKELLLAGEIDIITFTSPSTVSNLAAAFNGRLSVLNDKKIACIGPKTADAAVKAGLKVDIVAGEQTVPGLVEAIEEYFQEGT
jgi:uroporphyrinogen III methyltransferase/synthase